MPSVIVLLVYALAVARLTRLIAADTITEKPRKALTRRLWLADCSFCGKPGASGTLESQLSLWRSTSDTPLGVYLLTCQWCVGVWVSLVAAPVVWFWGTSPWLLVPALALAFAQTTGLLAKLGG